MKSPTSPKTTPVAKRAYRQGARAAASAETADRIIAAFRRRLETDWFEQITLEIVARDADVAVPTILRRFGGKEGLLEATFQAMAKDFHVSRGVKAGDVLGAVRTLIKEYDKVGAMIFRNLAQEERVPTLKPHNDFGRREHRAWIEEVFAPWLEGLSTSERKRRIDGLVMAMDLYVWQVVRRDMGRSVAHLETIMLEFIGGVLGVGVEALRNREIPK